MLNKLLKDIEKLGAKVTIKKTYANALEFEVLTNANTKFDIFYQRRYGYDFKRCHIYYGSNNHDYHVHVDNRDKMLQEIKIFSE